jgi:hypothetical protein
MEDGLVIGADRHVPREREAVVDLTQDLGRVVQRAVADDEPVATRGEGAVVGIGESSSAVAEVRTRWRSRA